MGGKHLGVSCAAGCSPGPWLLRVRLLSRPLGFGDRSGQFCAGTLQGGRLDGMLWSQPAWVLSLSAIQPLGDRGQVMGFNSFIQQIAIY